MFDSQVEGPPHKKLSLSQLIDGDGPEAHTGLSSSLIGKLELLLLLLLLLLLPSSSSFLLPPSSSSHIEL